MPKESAAPTEPEVLLDLDFGDAELTVRLHPDGMFTIDLDEPRLLLNRDQFMKVVAGFASLHGAAMTITAGKGRS